MRSEIGVLQTSPHLSCIDRSERHLTFSHYGNIATFNTHHPELALEILSRLRGGKPLRKLLSELPGYRKGNIKNELDRLIARSYVLPTGKSLKSRATAAPFPLLSVLGGNRAAAEAVFIKLSKARLGVIDQVGLFSQLKPHLVRWGFRNFENGSNSSQDLVLVLGHPSQQLSFSKLNQDFFSRAQSWLLVTLDSFGGVIGPAFGSEGGPCYDCLIDQEKRQYSSQQHPANHADLIENPRAEKIDLSDHPLAANLMPLVASEVMKLVSKIVYPKTQDGFYAIDLFNFRMKYLTARPSPVCPVCSGRPR